MAVYSLVSHIFPPFYEKNGGVFRRRIPLDERFEKTGPECRVHAPGPLTRRERGGGRGSERAAYALRERRRRERERVEETKRAMEGMREIEMNIKSKRDRDVDRK